nr:MAG TPA: hypothetical protein [Crassvirales sp.]
MIYFVGILNTFLIIVVRIHITAINCNIIIAITIV